MVKEVVISNVNGTQMAYAGVDWRLLVNATGRVSVSDFTETELEE